MEAILGYFAAVFTTLSFLPQVLRVVLTKQTRDISRNMYILLGIGVFLWLIYGFFKSDLPIILANGFTLIFVLIILYYKIQSQENQENAS